MQWLMSHYHACCALIRVRSLEKKLDCFQSAVNLRFYNHNTCIDATIKHADNAHKKVVKCADLLELVDAGQSQHVRDIVDLSEQIVVLHQQVKSLNERLDHMRPFFSLKQTEPSRN